MAYAFTSASQQWISTASSPVADVPLTMCCWANSPAAAFAGLISVGFEASGTGNYYRLATGSDGTITALSADGFTVPADAAISTASYTNGIWFHAAAVFSANDSRTTYLNAGSSATNTNSNDVVIDANTHVRIGRRHFQLDNMTGFFTGAIAEAGIWNVALTADEIASLAKGVTCNLIRPQSLVFYAPLIRDLQDVRGGLTIANNNGATVANHPRVYR